MTWALQLAGLSAPVLLASLLGLVASLRHLAGPWPYVIGTVSLPVLLVAVLEVFDHRRALAAPGHVRGGELLVAGPQIADLRFGDPYVRRGVPFVENRSGAHELHNVDFLNIGIANHGTGGAAEAVVVVLTFHGLDGLPIPNVAEVTAHWSDHEDAGLRSVTIAANRDPHAIDIVMKIDRESVCWVYVADSPQNLRVAWRLIPDRDFIVRAEARSSNCPDVRTEIHVRHRGTGHALEIVPLTASAPE